MRNEKKLKMKMKFVNLMIPKINKMVRPTVFMIKARARWLDMLVMVGWCAGFIAVENRF
jgi:hypothetical protein